MLRDFKESTDYRFEIKEFRYFMDTLDDLVIRILYGGSGYYLSSPGSSSSERMTKKDNERINEDFYQALLDLGMQEAKDHGLGGQEDSFMCEIVDNYEVLELRVPFEQGIGSFGKNLHNTLKDFFGPKILFEFDEKTHSFWFPEETREMFDQQCGYDLKIERVEVCFTR